MPIGFFLGTIETNLASELFNVSPSLYIRKDFEVTSDLVGGIESLNFAIRYDDGFIIWLNGVELARRNMGASKAHIYHDQISHRASEAGVSGENITLLSAAAFLVEGTNTIAVQVNNRTLGGDMRLDFSLKMDRSGGPDVTLIETGSEVKYFAGVREPNGDVVEPALPTNDPSDWIELYNNGGESVDLTGWTLSEDATEPGKWSFPAGTIIAAGEFLLVLADAPEAGIPGAVYLHANFRLDGGGEFLGLYDPEGTYVSGFPWEYPEQLPNYSYGLNALNERVFFGEPTPGSANVSSEFRGRSRAPEASSGGGFYDEAITVVFTTATSEATIRYTTNGTEPTLHNGARYTEPLELEELSATKGHVIRARTFREGWMPSRTTTHTYMVSADKRLVGSPMLALAADPRRSLYDPYGALALNGGRYVSRRWQPTGPFDFNNIIERGRAYERPGHAEFFFADGTLGFQSDLGLRIAASPSERPRMKMAIPFLSPWEAHPNEKPSFNLYVRNDYGADSVEFPFHRGKRAFQKYERFRIRAGKEDISNPFIIDEFVRRLSHEMGMGASLGVINSLIVNGEYKGYYNLIERLRSPFFSRLHQADEDAAWDVLAPDFGTNIAEGDKVAWNEMLGRLNSQLTTENWGRVLEVTDAENVANYFLLNIYCGTWEWPGHNWVIAKERSAEGRFRLYIWDAEGALGYYGPHSPSKEMIGPSIIGTILNNQGQSGMSGELRDLWRGLNRWPEFRLLFADQVHKHLFNGGVLDDQDPQNSQVKEMFDDLVQEFTNLADLGGIGQVRTSSFDTWIHPTLGRRNYLLGPAANEFRKYDLWPEVSPPKFQKFGGLVSSGFPLFLTSEGGTIYYTTDGSDPRLSGGAANPQAVSQPGASSVQAVFSRGREWAYSDTDGDLGQRWIERDFDDSSWERAKGPHGYGTIQDDGVTIEIPNQVNQQNPRQPTIYFRKDFVIPDVNSVRSLDLSLLVDGGAIIYLNGIEVFRESTLVGEVAYSTVPTLDVSDGNEGDYAVLTIAAEALVEGMNVLAVEIHNSPGNYDMAFDLALGLRLAGVGNFPVVIEQPLRVKARAFDKGVWSALTEASFTVNSVNAEVGNLAITELLYNPVGVSTAERNAGFNDGDLFEYVRLRNFSGMNIDLRGVRFADGISFDFSESAIQNLRPGGKVIVVRNLEAFRLRFGNQFDDLIAGEYSAKLSNGGERVLLLGAGDEVIQEFQYETGGLWPDLALLDGHSIQLESVFANHAQGGNWNASESLGGSPGGPLLFTEWQRRVFETTALQNPIISGENSDPDGDGWANFLEFAFGSDPLDNLDLPKHRTVKTQFQDAQVSLRLGFDRPKDTRAVTFLVEGSNDLISWVETTAEKQEVRSEEATVITCEFRFNEPRSSGRFYRLKVKER